MAIKRKRKAELEVMRGEERKGLSNAHVGQEGGGPSCGVYQLPPAHPGLGPISPRLHPALLSGSATLTTTAIVAAPSAAVSCLIFLPAPDRTEEGDRTQLPCPATTLPHGLERPGVLKSPASVDRQTGFCPPLLALKSW